MEEVSVKEVAEMLRLSRDTVLRLIRRKKLVAHRKSVGLKKSAYVVDAASVRAYDTERRA
jgi:excisionase family DNA binding protein